MVKKLGTSGADIIKGTAVSDTLYGLAGNDTLYGYAGVDLFYAGSGNDKLIGGKGADLMQGGTGNDTYYVDNVLDDVVESVNGGIDRVVSSVSFTLTDHVERLSLSGIANLFATGNDLANAISGNAGNNRITGGGGKDSLFGGLGADRFIYKAATDSAAEPEAGNDVIKDFKHGVDKIDLSAIDAITHIAGNNAFRFIGEAGFTNNVAIEPDSFAEVRFNYDAATGYTLVQVNIETAAPTIDVNTENFLSGDLVVDTQIQLKGNIALTATDFVL
jgi:Ca2+-binding RTX toxin-like protein